MPFAQGFEFDDAGIVGIFSVFHSYEKCKKHIKAARMQPKTRIRGSRSFK